MTRLFLACCLACAASIASATGVAAQDVPNRAEPANDASFMRHARATAQSEIDLAELVQGRGQDEGVKALASKIKTDDLQMVVDLKALASSKHVDLVVPVGLDKTTRDQFTKLSGAEFDRAYLDRTGQDHRQTTANFIQASGSADEDVRAFAQKVLPTLSERQRQADELQKKFGERAKAR